MSAVLLPREIDERPLALGVLYPSEGAREADALIETMKHGISQVFNDSASEYPSPTNAIEVIVNNAGACVASKIPSDSTVNAAGVPVDCHRIVPA